MKHLRGFSLIELLLVIAIIGIIAAIAVPNLLNARRAANEGSAVSALRTIYGANMSFAASAGAGRYAGTPATVGTSGLEELHATNYLDEVLGYGEKSGYKFIGDVTVATPTEPATFYFSANPANPAGILATGTKRFGVSTDGVLHVDATQATLGTPFDAATLQTAPAMNTP